MHIPKIYLAGGFRACLEIKGEPLMISYADKRQIELIGLNFSHDFLIDSGAFTVWKKGMEIKLEDYAAFCNHIDDSRMAGFISLDVIGGTASENLENYKGLLRLLRMPEKIVPVFHEGDAWGLLRDYLRLKPRMLAVGLVASRGKPKSVEFLREFFRRLDEMGGSGVPVHGLGITREETLLTFRERFASVDSSSWLNFARYSAKSQAHMIDKRTKSFQRAVGVFSVKALFDRVR